MAYFSNSDEPRKPGKHEPSWHRVPGTEEYTPKLSIFGHPKMSLSVCCGLPMWKAKMKYTAVCAVCQEKQTHVDHRDWVICQKCDHIRDVTDYGDCY